MSIVATKIAAMVLGLIDKRDTVTRSRRNTLALLGSSTPASYEFATTGHRGYYSNSMINQWLIARGQPLRVVANLGVAGTYLEDAHASYIANVRPTDISNILISGGINNITRGDTAASIIAEMESFIDDALMDGKIVTVCNFFSSNFLDTEAKQRKAQQVNNALFAMAMDGSFELLDVYSRRVDFSTGYALTGTTRDGHHHNAAGAMLDGLAMAVQSTWLRRPPFVSSMRDRDNFMPNPALQGSNASGTNGFTTAAGYTGNGPDGVTLTASNSAGTIAVAARADGLQGNTCTINATMSASHGSASFTYRVDLDVARANSTSVNKYLYRTMTGITDFFYRAENTGTTAAAQPGGIPQVEGDTFVDGGVTWRCFRKPVVGDVMRLEVDFENCAVVAGSGTLNAKMMFINGSSVGIQEVHSNYFDTGQVGGASPNTQQYPIAWPPEPMHRTMPYAIPVGTSRISCRVEMVGANSAQLRAGIKGMRLVKES